ncbi:MAG: TRAP transporter fused permease subunit [Proteobacteria bacterium]|nr:TRAP transporter fused permease subunit [Pseudomonadota bacterium]
MDIAAANRNLRLVLSLIWLGFQVYIIFYPQIPLIQRPAHVVLALAIILLATPLSEKVIGAMLAKSIDFFLLIGVFATTAYYLSQADRLTGRMEGIDEILALDIGFGILVLVLMLECVRRVIGWSLLLVIGFFLVYGFFGSWFPGWLEFGGFTLKDAVENFTMTANGVLGITTETSVLFVFYFVVFGVVYSAIGGGQLFIDIGIKLTGKYKGGAAKAAVVSSSLMGSISGSAVANVAATGVFTIPLMRRTGLSAEAAAATEAIASTGGQLMPPIMGIAAFVMAELLQISYAEVAVAGIIPAVAFYVAIFIVVDLRARKTGIGSLKPEELDKLENILPRLYLLAPPLILVGMLIAGYSATYSAVIATASCIVTAYLHRKTWLDLKDWVKVVMDSANQAAQVAIPIAAIGIIISVSIQSNLALKFSTRLIEMSGGTLYGAMGLIIIGCIIMGMGLPTVAAYIIGAILFVPTLLNLGIPELAAHFFVMYYCVLSMVTPPVALASYTAAGLAKANTMTTSILAFWLSLVSFFIPFAFAFDEALLGRGDFVWIALAFSSMMVATAAWGVALVGYLNRNLTWTERLFFAAGSLGAIFSRTGTVTWGIALSVIGVMGFWCFFLQPRLTASIRKDGQASKLG